MTLGRLSSAVFPVPMSYTGAKAEFVRRVCLDKDVRVLFRMLQTPMFNAIVSQHLSDVGMEGRDQLDKLANVDLTHEYYYHSVMRDINEGNMVRHVRVIVGPLLTISESCVFSLDPSCVIPLFICSFKR